MELSIAPIKMAELLYPFANQASLVGLVLFAWYAANSLVITGGGKARFSLCFTVQPMHGCGVVCQPIDSPSTQRHSVLTGLPLPSSFTIARHLSSRRAPSQRHPADADAALFHRALLEPS